MLAFECEPVLDLQTVPSSTVGQLCPNREEPQAGGDPFWSAASALSSELFGEFFEAAPKVEAVSPGGRDPDVSTLGSDSILLFRSVGEAATGAPAPEHPCSLCLGSFAR